MEHKTGMQVTEMENLEKWVKAAGYIRVSQERSARNGYGLSAQEAEIKRFIEYKDWDLVKLYQENGVSGYQAERPALQQLLQDARDHKFKIAIFPSIDRVGRSVKDVIEIDTSLRKLGIDTIFLREGVDTSTPTGALYRNIMSSVAEFEGRLIYERLSKGKREKAAGGGYIGGYIPYGYRKTGHSLEIEPDEAEVVEQIFKWRFAGKTFQWMAERLTADNIVTKRGGTWRVSTVMGIVRNRFYTGRVEFEGTYIRAQHDAIVSDVLFKKAQGNQ